MNFNIWKVTTKYSPESGVTGFPNPSSYLTAKPPKMPKNPNNIEWMEIQAGHVTWDTPVRKEHRWMDV